MENTEIICDLQGLEEHIKTKFPKLESKLYDQFLRVSRVSLQGLKYLANFSLIFSELQECKFCVSLITYHGRTLDTIIFQSSKEEILPEKVTSMLLNIQDRIILCQGLEFEKAELDANSCLIECLNDIFIVRSKRCKFLLPSKSETKECGECQKVAKIKDEDYQTLVHAVKEDPEELMEIDKVNEALGEPNGYNEFVDYEEDETWTPETFIKEPKTKKKRGRPPKLKELTKKDISPKKRGRPRLVSDPNDTPTTIKKPTIKTADLIDEKCKICLKPYRSKYSLKKHYEEHQKYCELKGTVECPLCKKPFDKLKLTGHFQEVHSSPQKAQTCCVICLAVIPITDQNGHNLRLHINNTHDLRKNICEICGKVFVLAISLDCHRKTVHSDVKEFFCERCGKGFGHQLALSKHVEVSCAVEEWKCPICAKMFNNRQRLRIHLMVHCEVKPYTCKHCAYRSYKADNLSLHVKKSHQMKGVRSDFNTLQDALKIQTDYCENHLKNARIK